MGLLRKLGPQVSKRHQQYQHGHMGQQILNKTANTVESKHREQANGPKERKNQLHASHLLRFNLAPIYKIKHRTCADAHAHAEGQHVGPGRL